MIKLDIHKSGIGESDLGKIRPEIMESFGRLVRRESEMMGWLDLPERLSKGDAELERVLGLAEEIRTSGSKVTLLVIGIGGSYLGARSFIEAAGADEGVEVLYAGNHMSNRELVKTYKIAVEAENLYVVVISKSGTTLEPALAFNMFEKLAHEKYGAEANKHIVAITDAHKGVLHDVAKAKNYGMFVVPDDIGGRYSIFTPVGMLPIAIACGVGTARELVDGAYEASRDLMGGEFGDNAAMQYAAVRNLFYRDNKKVELLASWEPSFGFAMEWWKQLFGESEGKDGKGLWVSSAMYSTDLHSLGQFVQDGSPILFETFVEFADIPGADELPLEASSGELDGLEYLDGKTLAYVQKSALEATKLAHARGNTPNISLVLPDSSAKSLGYFYYFMMLSCAISAYTLGVEPFDQPGVEMYKQEMFRILGK
ncbi:glucose-6-phosphate isomerase [Candidatus Saccharibacteria bacterium]|nr:glucose-6-phosphate isomerase [Candidatus Saccharibacteria bacterium]